MNHFYRVIFNKNLGVWQVVHEMARGRVKSGRSNIRRLSSAGLLGALLTLPVTLVHAQSYTGTEVVTGPISDGIQEFHDQALLRILDQQYLTGGNQQFFDTSELRAETQNAVSGGQQVFNDTSMLDAILYSSVSGGEQTFLGNSVLNAHSNGSSNHNALNGGVQSFYNNSRLEADYGSIGGGTQSFYDNSQLNAGIGAIQGGIQNFYGHSILRTDSPPGNGIQSFYENSTYDANGYFPIASDGARYFYDDSTLNINSEESTPQNSYFYDRSVVNVNARNALLGGEFHDQSTLKLHVIDSIANYSSTTFYDQSSLTVDLANAISGGDIQFHGDSTLNANVENAIVGGSQYFDGNSTFNINASGAVTYVSRRIGDSWRFFGGNSTVNLNATHAINGIINLVFNGDSTVNANAVNALNNLRGDSNSINTTFRWFEDNSTFNANVANAISNEDTDENYLFTDNSTLNAKVAQSINGGRILLSSSGTVNANATNAISDGILSAQSGVLNANIPGSVNGGLIELALNAAVQVHAADALTIGTAIQFGRVQSSYQQTGGQLVLNGYSTAIGQINELSPRLVFGGWGPLIQNTGNTDATLTVDGSMRGSSYFSGRILDGGTGKLNLVKSGGGVLTLDGVNTYTGTTSVEQGTLIVGSITGLNASVTGAVSVANGATLAGNGSVGATTVASGGRLAPGNTTGTLTIEGDLTMNQDSIMAAALGVPSASDATGEGSSVHVNGNLTLNGVTLNISDNGGFGTGLYRLFDYSGELSQSNSGLALGLTPLNTMLSIQYLDSAKQINLVSNAAGGPVLNFWNANGEASSTQLGGGSGIWSNMASVWTDAMGSTTGPMQPHPGFAIFAGLSGEVVVNNATGAVQATGLQFASDGYALSGDVLTLVADDAHPAPVEVRVGDGSNTSASFVTSIDNILAGIDGLNKTGLGTLVLNSANTYSGDTRFSAGVLSVNADTNLGALSNTLIFNGGTLKTTANVTSERSLILEGTGTLNTADSSQLVLEGVIAGNGALTKTGNGTLTLNHTNNYQGGTNIEAGLLFVQTTGALGSGPITVSGIGTALNFKPLGNMPLSTQKIQLHNLNGAITTFSGDATADNINLLNEHDGTIVFSDQSSAGRAQIYSHTGGKLIFQDQSTAGNASITNQLDSTITFKDRATANSMFLLNNGQVDISGLTTDGIAIGMLAGSGSIALGNKELTLGGLGGLSGIDGPDHFSGVISGEGMGSALVKTGAGTLVLDGINTYTGSTTVSQGRLVVGNQMGSSAAVTGQVSVAAGATLAGLGTVGSTSVASGGILTSGSSIPYFGGPGTLKISGNLTMSSGSILQIQADPSSNSNSRIAVTGTAYLQEGATIDLGTGTNYKPGINYTLLSADGGVQGTFTQAFAVYAYLTPTLSYTPRAVMLELVQAGATHFADLARSNNQRAVANSLESLPTSSALYQSILTLPEGAPATAFNSLSGEAHASTLGAIQASSATSRNIPFKHLRNNLSTSLGGTPSVVSMGMSSPLSILPGMNAPRQPAGEFSTRSGKHSSAYALSGLMNTPTPKTALPPAPWGLNFLSATLPDSKVQPVWVEFIGSSQTLNGDAETARTKQETAGFSLGMDQEVVNDWRVGVALGFSNSDIRVDDRQSKNDVNNYSAMLYGGKAFPVANGNLNWLLGTAYTWHRIDTQRLINVADLKQTLKADYGASTVQLFTELGYAIKPTESIMLEPYVGLAWSDFRSRGFSESGGSAALNGYSQGEYQTSTTLGLRAQKAFTVGETQGSLRGALGWQHLLGNIEQQATMAFSGSQAFTVTGAPIARDTPLLELGIDMALTRNTAVGLGYTGQYGNNNVSHAASVNLRWAF